MRVRWTVPALSDLEEILDYLGPRSPQGSARVKSRIKFFVNLLTQHPLLGAPTDDATVRRLVITPYPYLVFYGVKEGDVVIHNVRHAARNRPSIVDSNEK